MNVQASGKDVRSSGGLGRIANPSEDARAMHDALTDVLSSVRLRSTVFCRAELDAPWGVHTKGLDGGIFHAVVRGRCVAQLDDGGEPVELGAGDVILLPHGDPHTMRDRPGTHARPIRDLVSEPAEGGVGEIRLVGGGETTSLVCGRFDFERGAPHPLLSLLPRAIHLRTSDADLATWLGPTVQLVAAELERREPGASAVITRLADLLVVHAIRACVRREQAGTGWLAALRDPQVGRALDLVHGRARDPWTVDSLATKVGMSRSVFFDRWTRLVGEPPAQYLARWRMHLAARLLREESGASVAEIADRVGYGSEAAFSKAFKRLVGAAPSDYRRAARAA
jgi:AraC-like DNA-binding protein